MKTLAERALEARRTAGYTNRSEFARLVGVTASAIQQIEEGKTLSLKGKTLEGYVRVTGHTAEWLNSEKGPKLVTDPTLGDRRPTPFLRPISVWNDTTDLPPESTILLPRLDYYLSAGNGGPDPALRACG